MKKYDKKCRKSDKMMDVGIGKLYNYIDTWFIGIYEKKMSCI